MPGIGGLDVLAQVRQQELDVMVIMITALDTSDSAIAALRQRADDYIRKPIDFAECGLILERAVSRLNLRRHNAELQRQLDEKRRLLEAELARAAQVQADLLPRHYPDMPGLELAARCIPAREVGGDFYDWHLNDHDVLNIILGDVTGKGMPAALLMATVRAALRAVGRQHNPAAAMNLTARALEDDLEYAERFVTMFYGQIDRRTRRLSYVDAGHGHVFIRHADGSVSSLPAGGLPVGILSGQTYEQASVELQYGDALIVYSDGLVDSRPDMELGHAALAALLQTEQSARAMVDTLVQLADSAQPLPDDLTILVLRCTCAEQPA
jgi:serine phosphatase RsbU (regulator of sigma subunit)